MRAGGDTSTGDNDPIEVMLQTKRQAAQLLTQHFWAGISITVTAAVALTACAARPPSYDAKRHQPPAPPAKAMLPPAPSNAKPEKTACQTDVTGLSDARKKLLFKQFTSTRPEIQISLPRDDATSATKRPKAPGACAPSAG